MWVSETLEENHSASQLLLWFSEFFTPYLLVAPSVSLIGCYLCNTVQLEYFNIREGLPQVKYPFSLRLKNILKKIMKIDYFRLKKKSQKCPVKS